MVDCMVTSRAPDPTDYWWVNKDNRNGYDLVGVRFNLAVATLRAHVENILTSPGNRANAIEEIMELKRRAKDLDEDIRKWEEKLPSEWQTRMVVWYDYNSQPKTASWSGEIPLMSQSTW